MCSLFPAFPGTWEKMLGAFLNMGLLSPTVTLTLCSLQRVCRQILNTSECCKERANDTTALGACQVSQLRLAKQYYNKILGENLMLTKKKGKKRFWFCCSFALNNCGQVDRFPCFSIRALQIQPLRKKITILGICPCIGIIGTKFCPAQTNRTIPSDLASHVYHNHKALIN